MKSFSPFPFIQFVATLKIINLSVMPNFSRMLLDVGLNSFQDFQ
jgi:hypothetical protein